MNQSWSLHAGPGAVSSWQQLTVLSYLTHYELEFRCFEENPWKFEVKHIFYKRYVKHLYIYLYTSDTYLHLISSDLCCQLSNVWTLVIPIRSSFLGGRLARNCSHSFPRLPKKTLVISLVGLAQMNNIPCIFNIVIYVNINIIQCIYIYTYIYIYIL